MSATKTVSAPGADLIDDHLGVLERRLGDRRLVVFTGMSGSGKSTYLSLLLDRHPDFAGREHDVFAALPVDGSGVHPTRDLVVLDELRTARDLAVVVRLLRHGHTVLAASHLPRLSVRLLGLVWPAAGFRTDASPEKLERYLERRGYSFTRAAVRRFASRYGANYVDLHIVLEQGRDDDFDEAFARFERYRSIELTESAIADA